MPIRLILIALLLSGCAEWTTAKNAVANYGAQAADENLVVTAWSICMSTPYGAIERKFNTTKKRKILNDYCGIFYGVEVE